MTTRPPDRVTVNSVFGTDLPQASSDERDPEVTAEMDGRDRWLRDNVPPHNV